MAYTTQPPAADYAYTLGAHSAPILHGEEKATQTYAKGAFLIDDDAGLIAETTSPVDASAVGNRTFGLAIRAATGVTSADVPLVWLTSTVVLEITLSDNTGGSHIIAAADKWAVYAPTKGTTAWALDANAVSDTGGMIVIDLNPNRLAGFALGTTTESRVHAILTNTARGGKDAGSGTF